MATATAKPAAEAQESWVPMIAIALGQMIMSFNVASLPVAMGGMVQSFNVPPTTVATGIVAYSMLVAGFVLGKLRGLDLEGCARLATAFSLGTLTTVGPHLPPLDTVEKSMDEIEVRVLTP